LRFSAPNHRLLGLLALPGIVLLSCLGSALILRSPVQSGGAVTGREPNPGRQIVNLSGNIDTVIPEKGQPARTKHRELRNLDFDVVSVDSTGRVREKHRSQAQYYVEDLGASANLEMVQVPAGTFMMGIPFAAADQIATEQRRHLGKDIRLAKYGNELVAMQVPQRPVTVQSFFIARFEVTQAQWRSIAGLPRVARDLVSDPALFKGDDLPVEEVTWEDAIEFCARLSRATGRDYSLPSEAQWEYACRAGTTTQFYFGDTITSELVNYNGDYPYGLAPKGLKRGQTVSVGSVGWPNEFGLCDMHGNVAEWCMDSWHENYNNAPLDGRVWDTPGGSSGTGCGTDYRVVRGGSWLQGPWSSAERIPLWRTNNKNYFTGLRIVCSVP
jgi:formylglycine-generating enzyme required for sulfatase activity